MSQNGGNTEVAAFYFGKFPARGDFVRSNDNGAILQLLDEWIAKALALVAQQAPSEQVWKEQYDHMSAIDVIFCGTKASTVIMGTLSASQDTSSRRFPLITGTRLIVEQPMSFIRQAPILAAPVWQQTRRLNDLTINSTDTTNADRVLQTPIVLNSQTSSGDAVGFLSRTTLGDLAPMLHAQEAGATEYLRLGLIALGLLLQPIVSQGAANLNKALVLPLAEERGQAIQIATFWMELVAGFIQQHHIEPQLLLTQQGPQWILIIGFQGASAETLAGLMQRDLQSDHWVHIFDAQWVKPYVDVDVGLNKLNAYLTDERMSLYEVVQVFKEVFLGK